jgi:hypothetical protein
MGVAAVAIAVALTIGPLRGRRAVPAGIAPVRPQPEDVGGTVR